jgi:poly-gamma-glutamate synthesis protein (capsule biosynthesis protein)
LAEKINRLFWAQDFNFINLEGAITSNNSVSNVAMNNPNHFRFTFDRQNSQDFFNFNRINLVSGANNHILNFGQSGEEETKKFLEEQKIAYFGMPSVRENNSVIQEIKGKKIGFVAYNYSAGLSEVEVIAEIEKMKKVSDFVVVSAHWGLEYHLQESVVQKDLAHKFIDSGADLVIGSHPHVVQPIEIYKNKVIFYSLGNLVFDQYFDDDVRQRLMVGAVWEGDKIGFYLIPLIADKTSKLELMNLDLRNKFLERIAKDSSVDEEVKAGIKLGKFEVKN